MLRKLLLSVLVIVFIFYALLALLITPLSNKGIEIIKRKASKLGVELHKLSFGSVYTSSPTELTWNDALAQFSFPAKDFFLSEKTFSASADKVSLRIKNLHKRKFGLAIRGLTLQILGKTEGDPMEYIEGQDLEIKFQLNSIRPDQISAQAKNWANGLSDLLIYGHTSWPITFSGATYLTFRGKPARVRLSVHPEGESYVLTINRKDLEELSKKLIEPVTSQDLDLISKYPLRAPALLKISDYAAYSAHAAHKKTPAISENCYRHTLWSYLLTKQFGEKFAITFTNAHEAGDPDIGGDSEIDLRNNIVGRSYALEKIPEASIASRLLTDPRAVLSESEWPKMKNAVPLKKKKKKVAKVLKA